MEANNATENIAVTNAHIKKEGTPKVVANLNAKT